MTLVNLNRLQFYIFYQRNYCQNVLDFIQKINEIMANEDKLLMNILEYFGVNVASRLSNLMAARRN